MTSQLTLNSNQSSDAIQRQARTEDRHVKFRALDTQHNLHLRHVHSWQNMDQFSCRCSASHRCSQDTHLSDTPNFTRHQSVRSADCNEPFIVNNGIFLSNTFSVLTHSSATIKSPFTCRWCEAHACLVSHRSHVTLQVGNPQGRWWPDQRHPRGSYSYPHSSSGYVATRGLLYPLYSA
jgi:hypothetical protein